MSGLVPIIGLRRGLTRKVRVPGRPQESGGCRGCVAASKRPNSEGRPDSAECRPRHRRREENRSAGRVNGAPAPPELRPRRSGLRQEFGSPAGVWSFSARPVGLLASLRVLLQCLLPAKADAPASRPVLCSSRRRRPSG